MHGRAKGLLEISETAVLGAENHSASLVFPAT
jgi:hypothetical protein